jgi:predicted nucleic-acid-binding Zn-ribbon protein
VHVDEVLEHTGQEQAPLAVTLEVVSSSPSLLFPEVRVMPEVVATGSGWTRFAFLTNGSFETLGCRGCGYTGWRARGVEPHPKLEPLDEACLECGDTRAWRVQPVEERADQSVTEVYPLRVVQKGFPKYWGEGEFALRLCRGCGLSRWLALGMSGVELSAYYGYVEAHDAGPCACGRGPRVRVEKFQERGPTTLNVANGRGSYSLLVCRDCGDTEWYAHGLDKVKADPRRGVSIVSVPEQLTPSGGPYR